MTNKENKTCFVVCPIGGDGTDIRIKSDLVLNCIIEEALPENYEIIRADMITESGKISTQIVNKLLKADLVIADLTDQNPNVFYELAVRHATKRPFIQIAEIDTELPFDVSDMRTIFYKLDEPDKLLRAIKELKGFVENLEANSHLAYNSPITETILYNHIDQTGTDQEKMLANIMQGINNIHNELSSRISYLEKLIKNQNYPKNRVRHYPPNLINDDSKLAMLNRTERDISKLKEVVEVTKANLGDKDLPPELFEKFEREFNNLFSRRNRLCKELNIVDFEKDSNKELGSDPSDNTKFDDF